MNDPSPQGRPPLRDGPLPSKPEPAAPIEIRLDAKTTLDMDKATPEMLAALAKAQSKAETVGRDEKSDQFQKNYTSAEAMIRVSRSLLSECELAFISTVRVARELTRPAGSKQWSTALIQKTWILAHSSGGFIRGVAECYAIEGGGRAGDKAVAAADTYLHGYVIRNLLNLDRADEDKIAVDRREDGTEDEPRADRPRRTATNYESAETRFNELWNTYSETDQRPFAEAMRELLGYRMPKKPSIGNFQDGIAKLEESLEEARRRDEPPEDA